MREPPRARCAAAARARRRRRDDDGDPRARARGAAAAAAGRYQLGPRKAARTPWLCLKHDYTHHPDADIAVTGRVVPDIGALRDLCERAHALMMPGVPLAGWDVALTAQAGVCLLEANLMCNFFRGTFDLPAYLDFIEDYFLFCERRDKSQRA